MQDGWQGGGGGGQAGGPHAAPRLRAGGEGTPHLGTG